MCACGGGLLSRLWNLCNINSWEGVFPLLREVCTTGEFAMTPHFLPKCCKSTRTCAGQVVLYLDRHGAWGKKEV